MQANRTVRDLKLSTRWTLAEALTGYGPDNSYSYPLQQIQIYCGESWNARYGYIITQEELVVLRISRQTIDPGLASTRSKRNNSVNYESHMSIDGSSPKSKNSSSQPQTDSTFKSHYGSVEYNPIEYKPIPWDESGKGKLTVKLALWWLHMMAAAPGCDISVETEYPPLDSWSTSSDGKYRHSSTGVLANKQPLDRSTEPSTSSASQRRPVAASQSAQNSPQQSLPSRPRPTPAGRESQRDPKAVEGKGKGRMC